MALEYWIGLLIAVPCLYVALRHIHIRGWNSGAKAMRQAAVEEGHAEWVVWDSTGKTIFRWGKRPESKESEAGK